MSTESRLVLPDILTKSKSGDSQTYIVLQPGSKQVSERQQEEYDARRNSYLNTSEVKYNSSNLSSGNK